MVIHTKSEILFENLCKHCNIPWRRVEKEGDKGKLPDYEISPLGHLIIVEVKQFDPNVEEKQAIKQMERGEVGTTGTKPGDRIRKAIHAAAPQLRALSRGQVPAMLVVYNNVLGSGLHTDPYAVLTAMQGLDVVVVPMNPSASYLSQETRSGPFKKMTENDNTSISAIGVLCSDAMGCPRLQIYHNRYARNPMNPDWMRKPEITHHRIPDGATSSMSDWENV